MFTARHIDDSYTDDPSLEELNALFDELLTADVEHGDVSLTDESSGWCISAHRDGRIVICHLGEGNERSGRHMIPVSKEKAIMVWQRFMSGGHEAVIGEPWIAGYV